MKIPGPQEVFESSKTTSFSQQALQEIQSNLSDPKWVRNWTYGSPENPYFDIVLPGFATEGDKQAVIYKLLEAGWSNITVINSDENGERGGLVGIKFYRNPKPAKPIEVEAPPLRLMSQK